jgi:hypothetical protein
MLVRTFYESPLRSSDRPSPRIDPVTGESQRAVDAYLCRVGTVKGDGVARLAGPHHTRAEIANRGVDVAKVPLASTSHPLTSSPFVGLRPGTAIVLAHPADNSDSCVADCSRLQGGGRGIEALSAHERCGTRLVRSWFAVMDHHSARRADN